MEDTYMEMLLSELGQRAEQEQDIGAFTDNNMEGKKIVGVIYKEHDYYFNSRYSDTELIDRWCRQEDISHYRTVALVFGIGNGEYVRELRRRNEDMNILIFEPSYSIAKLNIEEIGIGDILQDERITLIVGKESYENVHRELKRLVAYEDIQYTKLFVTPNYENLFKEELKSFYQMVVERADREKIDRNTILALGDEIYKNVTYNFVDCIEQYGIKELADTFEGLDKTNIPAIIVAAGPSLDKNVHELKRAKGKSFIIAVDTSLNSLVKEGIVPDIAVTVDPHKHVTLFSHETIRDIPLIFSLAARAKVKSIHRGIRIYQNSMNTMMDKYIVRYKKKAELLETGGSVANDAFSLARRLGFKTIIFIGLDLAYPNDIKHTEAAYKEIGRVNVIDADDKEYFYVEDIYGGKVKTEGNMDVYRRWFEEKVRLYPDMRFIDATEGGAKKQGMEIITLKEAIDRECICDGTIDFGEIIQSIKPFFTEEERKEIFHDIMQMPKTMNDIRKRIDEGMRAYEKLDELNRKQKYTGTEFRNTMQKITEINNWLTKDAEVEYLSLYVAKEDYEVRENIFEEKANVYEEMKHIADSGKKMLESYKRAADRVEEDMGAVGAWWEKVLKERAEA